MKLLIKGGHVIDPQNKRDGVFELLIENGKIEKVAQNIRASSVKTIQAKGKIVMPGLVDMHVHLREPGREDKETVATATAAALKGGVVAVLAMPNTTPAVDSAENAELLQAIIKKSACCRVFIAGTITHRREGAQLSEIAKLKKKGSLAITDDGASVDSDELFFAALKAARENNLLVICHCEDKGLSDGVVNLGITSTRMGLRGISCQSEYKRVQRDIALAKKAGARIHIAHVSCQESVEIIAQAKKKGVTVTCETAPHYFTLSEEQALGFDTNMKVNPPLRSPKDVEAIKQGLKAGIIDAIASDHAPHTENEKDIEFERAAFGMIGLETALSLGITELVQKDILSFSQLIEKLSQNPARILGIEGGNLSAGARADIVIVDPEKEWLVERRGIVSKSKNSPFIGRRLKGVVEYTICSGKIMFNR